MKTRASDLFLTALAPIVWGSSYIVTTEFLPDFSPITVAMLRALPAGLILLLVVQELPKGIWWFRVFVLGALNFAIFWSMLLISAYRLPGGIAAMVGGATQPLIVVFLAAIFLGNQLRLQAVFAAIIGLFGVALLMLTPQSALDSIGIFSGLIGAVSMSFGTILTRKWQPPVSLLTVTAWQLTAGGILLIPATLLFGKAIPFPNVMNLLGFVWLGLIGSALTYALWFRGIKRIDAAVVASLGFLSPVAAILLGWLFLNETLTLLQITGFCLVIGSIWLSQRTGQSS